MRLFEIKDRVGRIIYLTDERWIHIITEHPELANCIEDIKNTVQYPLIILDDKRDIQVKLYFKYYKTIKSKYRYLVVVVKYLNSHGFIITGFYTDKVR